MAGASRVKITLSPSMEIALQYLARQEEAAEATVARRVLRAGLDRTIHSAAVQQLIAERRAGMDRKQWVQFQEEAAEQLANELPGSTSSS